MYSIDRFNFTEPQVAPISDPLTIEDIERCRQRMKALGLQDTALGRMNDKAGQMMAQRDGIKSQASDYVAKQLGLSGLSSAAGTSAATGALASSGAGAAAAAL